MIAKGKKNRQMALRLSDSEVSYIESFADDDERHSPIFARAFSNMLNTFANNGAVREEAERLKAEVAGLERRKAELLGDMGDAADVASLHEEKARLAGQIERLEGAADVLKDIMRDICRILADKAREAKGAAADALKEPETREPGTAQGQANEKEQNNAAEIEE